MAAEPSSSKIAVVAALIGNLLVAITKAIAAALTGSSSMLSEAVHSLVDTVNEVLLLYGMRRAAQRADAYHPFGYGRELYFWSFVVALLIFALGAGVSIFEGIGHVRQPEPVTDPYINYIVLVLALLFEGGSWLVSLRQFRAAKGDLAWFEAFRRSKDPPSFMVLFEDSAALVGIAIAAGATALSLRLDAPWIDGIGSILIGLVLGAVAIILARESKALLIGERAADELTDSLRKATLHQSGVKGVESILTTQLSPDQVIATLSVHFDDSLDVPKLEQLIGRIEAELRHQHPELFRVFVRPTPSTSDSILSYRDQPQRVARNG